MQKSEFLQSFFVVFHSGEAWMYAVFCLWVVLNALFYRSMQIKRESTCLWNENEQIEINIRLYAMRFFHHLITTLFQRKPVEIVYTHKCECIYNSLSRPWAKWDVTQWSHTILYNIYVLIFTNRKNQIQKHWPSEWTIMLSVLHIFCSLD